MNSAHVLKGAFDKIADAASVSFGNREGKQNGQDSLFVRRGLTAEFSRDHGRYHEDRRNEDRRQMQIFRDWQVS